MQTKRYFYLGLCRNLRNSDEKIPKQSAAGICPKPKTAVPHGPTFAVSVGQSNWKKKTRSFAIKRTIPPLSDQRGNVNTTTLTEGEVSHTTQSLRMNSGARSSWFWQRMRQATEWTPGHLKCTRIWMVGPFAKLLLLFWAKRSKMCFRFTFQLLCCIRRHSGLECKTKSKSSSWIVFPQLLPAFTLQTPIWLILPLVHHFQTRTNKLLSQSDIK